MNNIILKNEIEWYKEDIKAKELVKVLNDSNDTMKEKFYIREVSETQELNEIVDLQTKIWWFDYKEAVPSHYLKATNKIWWIVLWIFDKKNTIIWFCFTSIGIDNDWPYHYLHMIWVDPSMRWENIWFELLKQHYEISKKRNIKKITWTYDPLEPMNANLYIRKIWWIVDSPYLEDEYGKNIKWLNSEIPSDRFLISWNLANENVYKKLKKIDLEEIDLEEIHQNLVNPLDLDSIKNNKTIYVQIPENFQKIKQENFDLATLWRERTKVVFSYYLSNWYTINDFLTIKDDSKRQNFYKLERK